MNSILIHTKKKQKNILIVYDKYPIFLKILLTLIYTHI